MKPTQGPLPTPRKKKEPKTVHLVLTLSGVTESVKRQLRLQKMQFSFELIKKVQRKVDIIWELHVDGYLKHEECDRMYKELYYQILETVRENNPELDIIVPTVFLIPSIW